MCTDTIALSLVPRLSGRRPIRTRLIINNAKLRSNFSVSIATSAAVWVHDFKFVSTISNGMYKLVNES